MTETIEVIIAESSKVTPSENLMVAVCDSFERAVTGRGMSDSVAQSVRANSVSELRNGESKEGSYQFAIAYGREPTVTLSFLYKDGKLKVHVDTPAGFQNVERFEAFRKEVQEYFSRFN